MTQRASRAGGFSLTELLVALGILVILGSIILVSVNKARRSASIATQRFDFQTLTAGLEAYRQDFHQYPMVPEYLSGANPPIQNLRMLMTGLTAYSENASYMSGMVAKKAYLPPDKFARTTSINNDPMYSMSANHVPQTLADHWGNAIEYFPRYHPNGKRATTIAGIGPIYGSAGPAALPLQGNAAAPADAIFDARDGDFGSLTGGNYPGCAKAVLWAIGDDDPTNGMNNDIAPPETLRFDGGFILISAGPDGLFCNMNDPSGDPPAKLFTKYGNIYNFEP